MNGIINRRVSKPFGQVNAEPANSGNLHLNGRHYFTMRPRPMVVNVVISSLCRAGSPDFQFNFHPGARQHGNERIHGEQVYLSPVKVAYPGLGHTEQLGRLALGQLFPFDVLFNLRHQIGADKQVLRFRFAKAQITKNIPVSWSHFHGSPLILMACWYRAFARSMSLWAVRMVFFTKQ